MYSSSCPYSPLTVTAGCDACAPPVTIRIAPSILSFLYAIPSSSSFCSRLLHCAKLVRHDCQKRPPQQHRALFSRSIWMLWNIAPSAGEFADSHQADRILIWPKVKKVLLRFIRQEMCLQHRNNVECVHLLSPESNGYSRRSAWIQISPPT